MTSRAAHLHLVVAAQKAANDPLLTVATWSNSPTLQEKQDVLHGIIALPEASNDRWYDQNVQGKQAAKRFLSELIRNGQPRARNPKGSISRATIREILEEYHYLLLVVSFWEALIRDIKSSIGFGKEPSREAADFSLIKMDADQIRFIAEECWNALLLGAKSTPDAIRLFKVKARLEEKLRRKSNRELVDLLVGFKSTERPWRFIGLLSAIAGRDIPATLIHLPQ